MGDNNNRSLPIYHYFVDIAKEVTSRFTCLVVPARWYTASILQGDFTARMLEDKTIAKLIDFSDATECFPSVEIKGGICYFLSDKKHNAECDIAIHHGGNIYNSHRFLKMDGVDAFVRFSEGLSIIEKVKINKEKPLSHIVSSQNPFGFNSKVVGEDESKNGYVKILSKYRHVGYISPELVKLRRDYINKWKVMTPIAGEGGALPHKVTGKPFISEPGECCNGTYMIIGPFANKMESENAISYLKCKFTRFLVSTVQTTQNTKSDSYRMVPLQDFSKSWTDCELYEKYGLTSEEIAFIEAMIKPME